MGIKIETDVDYGIEYKDSVTGLVGKVTGILQHQFGCVRVCLQPKAKEDGTVPDGQWIDEMSLEAVEPKENKAGGAMSTSLGFPFIPSNRSNKL